MVFDGRLPSTEPNGENCVLGIRCVVTGRYSETTVAGCCLCNRASASAKVAMITRGRCKTPIHQLCGANPNQTTTLINPKIKPTKDTSLSVRRSTASGNINNVPRITGVIMQHVTPASLRNTVCSAGTALPSWTVQGMSKANSIGISSQTNPPRFGVSHMLQQTYHGQHGRIVDQHHASRLWYSQRGRAATANRSNFATGRSSGRTTTNGSAKTA